VVRLVTDLGLLMMVEHVAMLLAMAGAMLLRPDEYASHTHIEPTHADAAIAEQMTA
jgi:hypothetical protein